MRLAPLLLLSIPAFSADWSPRQAADYLDARQKAWLSWPDANKSGAPCISCHTQLTYMLVRPALRNALGEKSPTDHERSFTQAMRSRAAIKPAANPSAGFGTDSVLQAFLLATQSFDTETQQAFDRLWATQMPDGAWPWYNLNLDPWEMSESRVFGASIAALAVGSAPKEYRDKPEVREHVAMLVRFVNRDDPQQPFHNRLMLLWASTKLPEALPPAKRTGAIDQARQTQQRDGGWTIASLGPWKAHPAAPQSEGSNAYATALTAFVLEQAGVPASDPMLKNALTWLRSHQTEQGYWDASSLNKKYESGSMMENFMRDAATGFASLALLNASEAHVDRSARP
jgi:squalene-hopene/tetraprenyl-beta-curcumene cyclase